MIRLLLKAFKGIFHISVDKGQIYILTVNSIITVLASNKKIQVEEVQGKNVLHV